MPQATSTIGSMHPRAFAAAVLAVGSIAALGGQPAAAQVRSSTPSAPWTVTVTPTMCHLAAPSDLSFASWGNFQGSAGRIKAAVCGAHTMPHAELQYKEFWLKDTGPVYLPGLLAATLGFPGCP